MFHAYFGFSIKTLDDVDQLIDGRFGVGDVTGIHDDNIAGSSDSDCAFAFGNINTNCVHDKYSFEMYLQWPKPASLIACSIYWA